MNRITLIRCDDNTIWVTSDDDQIGTESKFNKITDEREQMLIALVDFFGWEPANTLIFDGDYADEIEEDE